jgi:hypothetical protein
VIVSKRRNRREPPLVSPHWWPLATRALPHCHAYYGDKRVADRALLTAVNQGELLVKIEWTDRSTHPPILLSVEDYELAAWIVLPRRPDVPPFPPGYAVFFWGLKMQELWPVRETEAGAIEQQVRRRPGPKPRDDWPILVGAWLIAQARAGKLDDLATNTVSIDTLVEEVRAFLRDEIGWAPEDPSKVRAYLVKFLRLV